MIDSPEALLSHFIDFSPSFKGAWVSDENYNINEDGTFNYHQVCAEYSTYFIHQDAFKEASRFDITWHETMDDPTMKNLFSLVEGKLDGAGDIDNALCTCFLENISQTKAGDYALQFMGNKSREFFMQWHS